MTEAKFRLIEDDDEEPQEIGMDFRQLRNTKPSTVIRHVIEAILTIAALLIVGYAIFGIYIIFTATNSYAPKHNIKPLIKCPLHMDDYIPMAYVTSFKEFIKKFERQYGSSDEVLLRLQVYKDQMTKINFLNLENGEKSATFGENKFADWTEEEFAKILLPKDHFRQLRKTATFIEQSPPKSLFRGEEIPDHFDWRPYNIVTPVKAQHQCGSCWAFATVATVESAYAVGNGELRSLSEQELLDCNLENNACNGGDVDKALRFVHDRGLMLEDAYPYVAQRQNTCRLHGDTTTIKVAYFLSQDEPAIIDWLIHYGPVNVGINVTGDMKAYKGGVYTPNQWECENKILGTHAINIVGYGTWNETGEKYWIVKNSWGDDWGIEHGYVYFARGINSCGIEDEPVGVLA